LRLSNVTDRGSILPHLEFSANSTLIDFSLNDIEPTFPNSRFALEMTLVTSNKSTGTQTLTNYRSIDDEHSPGVFEVRSTYGFKGPYPVKLFPHSCFFIYNIDCGALAFFVATLYFVLVN